MIFSSYQLIMILIGGSVFGWFAWNSPPDCPKEYLSKEYLDRGGYITDHCNLIRDNGRLRWILRPNG